MLGWWREVVYYFYYNVLGNEADIRSPLQFASYREPCLFTILHPPPSTTIKTNTVPPLLLSSITPSTATKSHRYPFLQLTYNTKQITNYIQTSDGVAKIIQHHFLH